MSSTGNETLERIQKEIKENLEKEDEWKRELERQSSCNGNKNDIDNNNFLKTEPKTNGMLKPKVAEKEKSNSVNQNVTKFIQSVKTKGVMHRFLKAKSKHINAVPVGNGNIQMHAISDFTYLPPRVTSETGTLSRNGFVSAEAKMKNEVQEFQRREKELRKERRKSQPELMAMLNLEEEHDFTNETVPDYSCSSSTSSASDMKSSRSLADLCNTPEEELDAPGTHNLIKQFENLKKF